jgi:serine/tyrosine/threonine adenylyltransferase
MNRANPAFIPRNHHVEAALDAATAHGDLAPFERLLEVLSRPFEDQPDAADLAGPAPPGDAPYRTFCGT